MSKEYSESDETTETSKDAYLGGKLNRRTFAKGAGTSLAIASSLGAMSGSSVAQTSDDDDSPGGDTGQGTDGDNQFRQMNKELYVAALAAAAGENGGITDDQTQNGDQTGDEAQSGGAGVAVFEAPQGQFGGGGGVGDDDSGMGDDDTQDDDDTDVGDDDDTGVGDDDTQDDDTGVGDDDSGTGTGDGSSTQDEVDSLDYHVFIMDADNVSRVTLNDQNSDEEVEELASFGQTVDDGMDTGDDTQDDDAGAGDDDTQDDDTAVGDDDTSDDDDAGMGGDGQQGMSGTIQEPLVVTGSLGQGMGGDDVGVGGDDTQDDDSSVGGDDTQGDGELDLQDFRQNPWDYYVAVHGDGDTGGEDGLDDDSDTDDSVQGSDAMLRGQVTTGLLEGEEEPGDRVSDDGDDGTDDDGGLGGDDDDDDGTGIDDDDGAGDDGAGDDGAGDDGAGDEGDDDGPGIGDDDDGAGNDDNGDDNGGDGDDDDGGILG